MKPYLNIERNRNMNGFDKVAKSLMNQKGFGEFPSIVKQINIGGVVKMDSHFPESKRCSYLEEGNITFRN